MANIFDYISWRGDLDFAQDPLNPVDNIIFSQLSYVPLDGIVPGPDEGNSISITQAAEIFTEKMRSSSPQMRQAITYKEDPAFISALGNCGRFGNCRLSGYVNHIDAALGKQFCALCINTGTDSFFIAYRGTDATIVGWKEDFNMSFSETVPSQLEAVKYLEKIAGAVTGPLRLGGHSKGGNLAVYAASFCDRETSGRITDIYTNDAPGFHRHVIESEGYRAIRDRIRSFVPQSSIVGMLLEHDSDYSVIKSVQTGLMQHDLYTWEVTHNNMVPADGVSQRHRFVDKTLRDWIAGLNYDQRQRFTEALFTILNTAQVKSMHELTADWFKTAGLMLQSLGNVDESTRKVIGKTLASLFRSARKNITLLKPQDK